MRYCVKERREQLGMTQQQLINRSGVSRSTIYALENGFEGQIKIETLIGLAKALQCKPEKLYKTR